MSESNLTGCPPDDEFNDYLAQALSQADAAAFEEHLETCDTCELRIQVFLENQSFVLCGSNRLIEKNGFEREPQPQIRRYQAMELIDSGGFGVVWKMLDLELNRTVAVKVMKARDADNQTLSRRFFSEAQISSQLSHPFVVPVHDIGLLPDGRGYFVMKYIAGKRLNEAFPKDSLSTIDFAPRVQAFENICQAIAFAHDKGVIHRDLKPQNVMVGEQGDIQVMDWGLAKVVADSHLSDKPESESIAKIVDTARDSSDKTAVGALGTYAYMSPEQTENAANATFRSDVFSLGAILCELLTGNAPYQTDSAKELRAMALRADLRVAHHRIDRSPLSSSSIAAICKKSLSPDPVDRYASAQRLLDDVTAYLNDQPVTARVEPISSKIGRWVRKHPQVTTGVATALILIASVLVVGNAVLSAKNRELKLANQNQVRQAEKAKSRFELALKAVKNYHSSVSRDAMLRKPELKELRKTLMEAAREFYEELAQDLESSESLEEQWQLAVALTEVSRINEEIGSTEDAIKVQKQVSKSSHRLCERIQTISKK